MEIVRPIAECTVPPDENCLDCSENAGPTEWQRVFQAPMNMERALPDGTKRKGFADMKEAARLKVDAAGMDHRKRGDINAEIRKLESIKK